MPIFENPSFVFVTCQVGAEPTLKKEIARVHPELKFAYSRPGFITFKYPEGTLKPDFELKSIFARAYGVSLARLSEKEGNLSDKLKILFEIIQNKKEFASSPKICVHLWERDQYAPSEEPLGFESGIWLKQTQEILLSQAKAAKIPPLEINTPAKKGQFVLDLVLLEENEWWIGIHQHSGNHSPFPGGKPHIPACEEAPSRAYIKLEEAILWSQVPFRKGDIAVEIGSAPGGASYSLLQHGLKVVGIDPAQMDPIVLKSKNFKHIPKPVASVLREDLPDSIQWLLLDMNVAPSVSIYSVDRLASRMKDSLLGLLLTVKLNQWKTAEEIPSILEHIQAIGMSVIRATQLPSNRQEIFIYALTRKGVIRSSSIK